MSRHVEEGFEPRVYGPAMLPTTEWRSVKHLEEFLGDFERKRLRNYRRRKKGVVWLLRHPQQTIALAAGFQDGIYFHLAPWVVMPDHQHHEVAFLERVQQSLADENIRFLLNLIRPKSERSWVLQELGFRQVNRWLLPGTIGEDEVEPDEIVMRYRYPKSAVD